MSMKIHYGVYSKNSAFCYLSPEGKVTTWGNGGGSGGVSDHLANDLSKNIVKIVSNASGYCALRKDGKVFSWGYSGEYCNYNSEEENSNYIDIFSGSGNYYATSISLSDIIEKVPYNILKGKVEKKRIKNHMVKV